jgi:hypothetical protein
VKRNCFRSYQSELDSPVGSIFLGALNRAEFHEISDGHGPCKLAGLAMAKAGGTRMLSFRPQSSRRCERAKDCVLSRIGRGDEHEAAQIRLAVIEEAELARAVQGLIGKTAANGGSMSPTDRLSLGEGVA